MLISVIMPSFNSGDYIAAAIRSVLSQHGPAFELIIQDGCSTDNTRQVVASFADSRILFVTEPDDGQSDAVNRAIARARGDWIVWLNADDMLAPNAFTRVQHSMTGPYDVIYGDYDMIDGRGTTIKRYRSSELSRLRLLTHGCYIFSGTLFVRRGVFEQWGPLDPLLHYCMDYEWLLRVSPHVRSLHCACVLAYFRLTPTSKTGSRSWSFFRESFLVRRRYMGRSLSGIALTGSGQLKLGAYLLTRRLWHSRAWRTLRSQKQL